MVWLLQSRFGESGQLEKAGIYRQLCGPVQQFGTRASLDDEQDSKRQRAYLALRLKKAGRKALQDITPPALWRLVAGRQAPRRDKAGLLTHAPASGPDAKQRPRRARRLAKSTET